MLSIRQILTYSATLITLLHCPYLCAIETSHHPEQFTKALEGKDKKTVGKAIYQHFCISCHAQKPDIPLGAPRIGMSTDWKARQQARTINEMLDKINIGMNAMPARGGCFECSDEQ